MERSHRIGWTRIRLLFCGIALSTGMTVAASRAAAFDQVIVFGDSLSDIGNINIESKGVYPGTPYYDGRYSNGPLWIEDLTELLGLSLAPSLTAGGKGRDYAYGGAEMTADQTSVPSVVTQTKTYLAAVSGKADASALYVVWAGINDLLLDWDNDPAALPNLPSAYAASLLNVVTLLKNAGAKYILIGEVPDAGKMPAWDYDATTAAEASADAAAMNAKAVSVIDAAVTKGSLSGVTFYVLPAFEMMDQIIDADIASEKAGGLPYLGFLNVTAACVDGPAKCANPNQYYFWDGVHPTVFSHALLAQRALSVVEP
jgi:phospholipase/lecithinase/hemolysin